MISTISRRRPLPRAALLCLLLAPSLAPAADLPAPTTVAPRAALGEGPPGAPILWHDHLRNGRTPARA
jgi:hypothetical protein